MMTPSFSQLDLDHDHDEYNEDILSPRFTWHSANAIYRRTANMEAYAYRSDITSDEEEKEDPGIGPTIYKYIAMGNVEKLREILKGDSWDSRTREGDTILHVAAKSGQALLIRELLPFTRDMAAMRNDVKDLPYHSAAKAGHFACVRSLVDWERYDERVYVCPKFLGNGNRSGNTPLHISLGNGQLEMSNMLFRSYPLACVQQNDDNITPMYIAAVRGYWKILEDMIKVTKVEGTKVEHKECLVSSKSILHACIEAANIEILELLLGSHKSLIGCVDENGRTALGLAARKGFYEGVRFIRDTFPGMVYLQNTDELGNFPIHEAAAGGNLSTVRLLLYRNSMMLVNKKGQNLLHIAASNGRLEVFKFLAKLPKFKELMNVRGK